MKLYAFVAFETGGPGGLVETGYVTKSILASNGNNFTNKRVKVMCSSGHVCYPQRKQITTIIPFSV
jgi:hypothetical protein